jgi:hypothetical protein
MGWHYVSLKQLGVLDYKKIFLIKKSKCLGHDRSLPVFCTLPFGFKMKENGVVRWNFRFISVERNKDLFTLFQKLQ